MIEERIDKEMNAEIEIAETKNAAELENEINEIRNSYLSEIAPFIGKLKLLNKT